MTTPNTPKFPATYCSQCGGEFGPGESGYSHCHDHGLTEADRIESDMAIHRYKQSGGPARDHQDRAVKLELQWSEAARLGGMLS